MKKLLLTIGVGLMLCSFASANIIPTFTSTTGSGPYLWSYQFQLSADQNANQGIFPPSNPVDPLTAGLGAFVTIYDFAGYVSGSCAGPTGWTCSAQNTGYTPNVVIPTDNSGITNITWSYTGPGGSSVIGGQPSGVDLGQFTAQSIYNLSTSVSSVSHAVANAGSPGSPTDNVGHTSAPSAVPEPASLFLIGGGLIALAGLSRRARKTA